MTAQKLAFCAALLFGCIIYADTLSVSVSNHATPAAVETVFVQKKFPCAYGQDEVSSFADELFKLGDYNKASIEYLRYRFLYPDDSCSIVALFQAGLCKEKAGEFAHARTLYLQLAAVPDARAQAFAAYRLPLTYFLENRLDSATASIDTAMSAEAYGALKYLQGWILLRQRRYSDALAAFEEISAQAERTDIGGSLSYLVHRAEQGNDLPYRSPALAGIMSTIVPGLGRGYCGRWGDALYSFIIIGATGGLAAYLWDSDRAFSSVMASFGGAFYLGNIYGSAVGAKSYNEEKRQEFWRTTWSEIPHPPTMLYSELPCERK